MKNIREKPLLVFLLIFVFLLLGIIITVFFTIKPMPISLIQEYGVGLLWEEGSVMNECDECHNKVDFHTCETCHDDHGAVELNNIPFSEIVELTGDVPDPSFVRINQILPDQENLGNHITLYEFLNMHGVDEFESVTFTTSDGGVTTIESQYLDETAMLVPYIDGVRFITESVHNSTWLKGINRIIIVKKDTPLLIDGKETSIGRLLIGETTRLIVEGSQVMLTKDDGATNQAFVANWVEGPRLITLLRDSSFEGITITDMNGKKTELTSEEIQNAIIAIVRDEVSLVLPNRGRSAWPTKIIKIESY